MKKRRLLNRVGCAALAFVLAFGMSISPIATQSVSAAWDTEITASVSISVKQGTEQNLIFEEGEEYDIASYFTVTCENLAFLYGNTSEKYYSDVYDEDGYEPIYKAFTISYTKVEGDGTETSLESAPSEEGTYKAYAKFSEESYYAYDENDGTLGYFWAEYNGEQYIKSGSLQFEIQKPEDSDEEVVTEGLQLLTGDDSLPDKDAFILLMLGDGFTAEQQQDFYRESKKIANYIMNTAPYDEFADTIKIYAYGTPSNESGARADKATTQDEANADTRDTYFGTSYWTGGMQRLLSVDSAGLAKVESVKNEVLPATDFSVIVVNASTYGGSGGDVCVASLNSSSYEMMLHELGHTVADLADEYWAGASYAAENVNMTTESDPAKVSWARFVGKNGIGVYKYEQSETSTDWYRPSDNCKMQYLRQSAPFCEVCKEELRKTFCENSNVTKIFFQTYADEFYQTDTGKDMKEYFILRRGANETTGDELGDALELVYRDAEGNVVDGIPSLAGDYTIEATFAGNETYAPCSMTAEYTIELPDLITINASSKVYDGDPADIDIKVDYDKEYTYSTHYTGIMPYTNYEDIKYDSDDAPIKPGKYTVEVKAYDKESGVLISKKSKSYQITFKVTQIVNNNGTYPGAQDWYNNKQIIIVGEGFTAKEQDKFEKAAKDYVDYILNTEPFKETQLYFNFTAVEVVSDTSGIGTEAGDTYYKLSYDENGKIRPENIQAIANVGYNNVSPYYKANIVIVNDDKNITEGARTADENRGYIYGGLDENSKEYVARELLNYLTKQNEGYVPESKEDAETQRTDLLRSLFYTWYGEDYAVVVSRAYDETFVEGESINMSDYFKTYILGKEVPNSEIDYTFTYYDSEGNKLDKAPTAAGSYKVLAEIIPFSDKQYVSDNDGKTFWELREDETVGADGEVFDAEGNSIGWLFSDPVTEVSMDGAKYYVPLVRGISTFKINSAQEVIKTALGYLDDAKAALEAGKYDEAQKYLELAKEMIKDGALAVEKNSEERAAMEEALEQVTQALKKSEDDKAALEKALEEAEKALKEAEGYISQINGNDVTNSLDKGNYYEEDDDGSTEENKEDYYEEDSDGDKSVTSTVKKTTDTVKTGDNTPVFLWLFICIAAVGVMIFELRRRVKKNK